MKQEGLKERMELLEIGEALGWPRLGYGRSTKIPHDKRIPPGKDGWERFVAHAHVRRIYPALRIGRVLRDNNVQVFHPLTAAEEHARVAQDGSEHRLGKPEVADSTSAASSPAADLLEDFTPLAAATSRSDQGEEAPTTPPAAPLPRRKRGGHKATRKAGRRSSRSK